MFRRIWQINFFENLFFHKFIKLSVHMMIYIKISQIKAHWSYPEKIEDSGHWTNNNSKFEVKFCFSEDTFISLPVESFEKFHRISLCSPLSFVFLTEVQQYLISSYVYQYQEIQQCVYLSKNIVFHSTIFTTKFQSVRK